MDYIIANIRISLPEAFADSHFIGALTPFAAETATAEPVTPALILRSGSVDPAQPGYRELSAFDFPDADADCRFGIDGKGYLFEMTPRSGGAPARYRKAFDNPEAVTDLTPEHTSALFRFGVWMLFNMAAAPLGAVAVHSSVIACGDGAVLFLGESGTGKSTHTRLWREHIPGAVLLNDDSPIVCIRNGEALVSGAPWSGKTPCYKNRILPIRAIVRLSQAPRNHIRRLAPIEAIGALLPSCPPAFAHDEKLQDAVCAAISAVLSRVPAYHLECLPDAAAAQLSFNTVFGGSAVQSAKGAADHTPADTRTQPKPAEAREHADTQTKPPTPAAPNNPAQ